MEGIIIMKFVIDIDDHLIKYPEKDFENIMEKYKSGLPAISEIEILNQLFCQGHMIILHTGRNWDKYQFTKEQLASFDIQYDELVMGKPQGIYVDIDSCKSLKEAMKKGDVNDKFLLNR
jgi:hypothetical protein